MLRSTGSFLEHHYNASKKGKFEVISSDSDNFTIKSKQFTFKLENVSQKGSNCSCINYKSFKLPCKHILFCRKMLNLAPFEPALVPQRWKKLKSSSTYESRSSIELQISSSEVSSSASSNSNDCNSPNYSFMEDLNK